MTLRNLNSDEILAHATKYYVETLLHLGILLHAVKFYNEREIYKASCSSLINSTTEYIDSNTRSPTHCHKIFCVLKLAVSSHKTYRFTDVVVYNIYIDYLEHTAF